MLEFGNSGAIARVGRPGGADPTAELPALESYIHQKSQGPNGRWDMDEMGPGVRQAMEAARLQAQQYAAMGTLAYLMGGGSFVVVTRRARSTDGGGVFSGGGASI